MPFKKPPRFKDTDLYFTEAGDFFLDVDTGDLADTSNDFYRGFIQRIDTRVSAAKGDWKYQPLIGVSLTDYTGKQNTADLGRQIKQAVYGELIQDDLLRPGEFSIDVLPVADDQLMIGVFIALPGTQHSITRTYTYSVRDNKIDVRS